MGWAHDLLNGDGGHSDVRPSSVAAVVLHSTQILGWNSKVQRPHTADSGPDSRPKPAATIAHPNSCPVATVGPEIWAIGGSVSLP